MSVHISAKKGEIANIVLMPGDPLRAKYMAERFLDHPNLVSQTRNVFYYTGKYQGRDITIGASGMGCPSIGIYSFELYQDYDVQTIIRIGTCGAYSSKLKLFDLINVERAYSESTYARFAFGYEEDYMLHEGAMYSTINTAASQKNLPVRAAPIHSSDIFYRAEKGTPAIAASNGCDAVEMEAFALFANARFHKRSAATVLTVSDIIPTHEQISADERERSLLPMMELVLEACVVK